MKAIALLVLMFSTSVFASQTTARNEEADQLYSVLEIAGAQGDCGMGRCGVTAENIACMTVTSRHFVVTCSADLQDASGGMTKATLDQKMSDTLTKALRDAGAREACVPGGCRFDIKSVDCTVPNSSNEGVSPASCTITQ